ncbi:hypothetical protein KUTeg_010664 [Tegillarca granosa]|uniref:DNA replication ATP-dependent helicase/nuclease n=1 Tax=Tegillarca granosa TaxID=220873 RepID=A0ABQ9F318_TEGGR|nr:hypothetical protein KUTeg_010664 [Tegillarca granosa]
MKTQKLEFVLLQSVNQSTILVKYSSASATTSLGTNHPLFTQRKFDICIVDEASQVLQPACLGPLFSAHKFVLVGDPKQLPPVVQCKEARNLGMDESLFSRLDDSGATYELNLHEIMSLSNKLVYNGALQCGSDKVANGQLHLSHSDQTEKIYKDKPWIKDLFMSEPYKAAILLDTDKVPAPEEREPSGLIKNVTEAKIVYHLVQTLIKNETND